MQRRRRRGRSSNGCVVFCPVFARPPPSSHQLAAFSIFSRIRKIGPRKFSNTFSNMCPCDDIFFLRSPCISTVPIYKHTTVCRKTRKAWGGSPAGYHLFLLLLLLRLYHRSGGGGGGGGGGGIRITHTKVRGEEEARPGPRGHFSDGESHGFMECYATHVNAIVLFVFFFGEEGSCHRSHSKV